MTKIIFILLSLVSFSSYADAPQSAYIAGSQDYPAQVRKDSRAAACSQYIGFYNAANSKNFTITVKASDNSLCRVFDGASAQFDVGISEFENAICANGSLPNTSLPLAQQCSAPQPVCTAGKTYTVELYAGSASAVVPTSSAGCSITIKEVVKCRTFPNSSDPAKRYCTVVVSETGSVSPPGTDAEIPPSGSSDNPSDVPPFNPAQGQGCPAGTKSLGIDSTGQSICGGSGTSQNQPPQTEVKQPATTVTNADGGTTKTEVTTRTNSDGSTTTTTKTITTGADGKVTTTQGSTTGASSSGGTGKNDSSDEKKDDFCLKNPNLDICKNSEVTGGGCNGSTDSTACTGDAISCAILRQQKKEYCENTAPSAMRTLGEQMLAGNDPLKGTFPTKENARLVNVPSLNQNGFIAGGSCFSDFQFSVSGQSFSIPFSKLCDYLIALRGLVMLLAALASWKLVSKSILG